MAKKYQVIKQDRVIKQDTIKYMFMSNHQWELGSWSDFFNGLVRTDEEERRSLARELSGYGLDVFYKWEREYRRWVGITQDKNPYRWMIVNRTIRNRAGVETVLSMYFSIVQQFGPEIIETALIFLAKAGREVSDRFVDEFLYKYGAHAERVFLKGLSSGDEETRSAILYHLLRRVQERRESEENWEAAFVQFQHEGTPVVEETIYSVLVTFIVRKLRQMGAPDERVASLISKPFSIFWPDYEYEYLDDFESALDKKDPPGDENVGIFESALDKKDPTAERILEVMLTALEQADWPRVNHESGDDRSYILVSDSLVAILLALALRGNQRVHRAIKKKLQSGDSYTKILLLEVIQERAAGFVDHSIIGSVLAEAFHSEDKETQEKAIRVLYYELVSDRNSPPSNRNEKLDYLDERALIVMLDFLEGNKRVAELLSIAYSSGKLSNIQKGLIRSREYTWISETQEKETGLVDGYIVTDEWTETVRFSDYLPGE